MKPIMKFICMILQVFLSLNLSAFHQDGSQEEQKVSFYNHGTECVDSSADSYYNYPAHQSTCETYYTCRSPQGNEENGVRCDCIIHVSKVTNLLNITFVVGKNIETSAIEYNQDVDLAEKDAKALCLYSLNKKIADRYDKDAVIEKDSALIHCSNPSVCYEWKDTNNNQAEDEGEIN